MYAIYLNLHFFQFYAKVLENRAVGLSICTIETDIYDH